MGCKYYLKCLNKELEMLNDKKCIKGTLEINIFLFSKHSQILTLWAQACPIFSYISKCLYICLGKSVSKLI